MQHFLYLKTEHFNKQILGINLAKLTQYQAGMVVMDKTAHAQEEYRELVAALKKLNPADVPTYFDFVDACIDLDYVLNGMLFVDRRAQMGAHTLPSYKAYREAIVKARKAFPRTFPYMFGYNMVHRANMAKHQGRVDKRPFKYGFDAVKPFGWQPPNWVEFFEKHVLRRRPRIAILGYSGAGKDTMGELLRDWYGYEYMQATMFILEKFLWYDYGLEEEYESLETAYADRVNHRKKWYDYICDINSDNPSTVANEIYRNSDIYCGIRSMRELEGVHDILDRVYWINCGKRIPAEIGSNEVHLDMLYKDSRWRDKLIVIQNHESLFKFKMNIYKAMSKDE